MGDPWQRLYFAGEHLRRAEFGLEAPYIGVRRTCRLLGLRLLQPSNKRFRIPYRQAALSHQFCDLDLLAAVREAEQRPGVAHFNLALSDERFDLVSQLKQA